jgi:hypothetical protein
MTETITLRASRWKSLGVLLIGAVFVATGLLMLTDPAERVPAVLGLLLFGSITILGAGQVARPATLTLNRHGFTVRVFPAPARTFAWSDIEGFADGGRFLLFRYAEGRAPKGFWVRASNNIATLPAGWRMPRQAVVELLQRKHAEALGLSPRAEFVEVLSR